VIIALVVGSSAPWWWSLIFHSSSGSPVTPQNQTQGVNGSPAGGSPVNQPNKPPRDNGSSDSATVPFGTAPKSWCKSTFDMWQKNPRFYVGIPDELRENHCDHWGIVAR